MQLPIVRVLIEPVVIQPLQQRWAHVRDSILVTLGLPTLGLPTDESAGAPHLASEIGPGFSPDITPPNESPALASGTRSPLSKPSQTAGAPHLDSEMWVFTEAKKTKPANSLLTSNPEAERQLAAWFDSLAAIRILDPACGSGNFLYVALRRLLDLWREARDFAIQHNIRIAITYATEKMVSPVQLYGIETEFYAHELAWEHL